MHQGTEQRLHERGRFVLRTDHILFAGAGCGMFTGIHTIDYCLLLYSFYSIYSFGPFHNTHT